MGSAISRGFISPAGLVGCVVDAATSEVDCLAPFDGADWGWGMVQVLSLMAIYGYILFYASNLLSDGSELLLLVPSIAGIVGSVVLPILGAVPDGAIMLFSGLGPGAQEQLSVGVGALAGSTIMLLTIPWGAALLKGSVKLGKDGAAAYGQKHKHGARRALCAGASSFGVTPDGSIRTNAKVMLLTSLIYLVIQVKAGPSP